MDVIEIDVAPASIGPFSQATRDGDRLFASGQEPVAPESGSIVGDDIGVEIEVVASVGR